MASYYNREYMEAHAEFAPLSPEDHRLVPQSGVQQFIFPDDDRHNAIWDYYVTSDKRHLFSACAEGDFAEGFKLYEYFPQTNTVQEIFKFDDTITNYPETIKASKIHTSLCEMEDGRIIFQSHTTAAAPSHPVWMPYSYRNHMWEGFPGSNVMIWDPKTNHVEDLGIPVRRESLYGGVYSAKSRSMFSSTMMNGHIYRFDLDNKKVTDYGNLTEGSCCKMHEGPDGHIYFASGNGDLMRININTLEAEDLGLRFVIDTRYKDRNDMRMMYSLNGPDGKIYFEPQHCELLQAYDPVDGKLEVIGSVMPEELAHYPHHGMIYGFDFDENGVLWYGLMTHPQPNSGYTGFEISFFLCSWDFLHGGKPINYGMMGTEKRRVLVFCEAHITDGMFIGADTNHWFDPISMFCVDLEKMKKDHAAGIRGPLTRDAYHYTRYQNGADVYPGDLGKDAAPLYEQLEKEKERTERFTEMGKQWCFSAYTKCYMFKPWRELGFEDGKIRDLYADEDGGCTIICGTQNYTRYQWKNGNVISCEKNVEWREKSLPKLPDDLQLPAAAGRRWIAKASAAVTLQDNRILVGTQDGLLGIVSGNSVFSLGSVGMNGPIQALCITGDRKKVYGAAGTPKDISMIFSYDDVHGLVQLGMISAVDFRPVVGEMCVLDHVSAMAVSADGSKLYIGNDDVKSTVVELSLA